MNKLKGFSEKWEGMVMSYWNSSSMKVVFCCHGFCSYIQIGTKAGSVAF